MQIATNNRHYLSEAGNVNPIEALFGADNPGVTSQGNRTYLKSVWNCSSASYSLRYRWLKSGFPEITGSGQASLCGLAKGNAVTVSLNINDLPNWGAGAYTLKLDVERIQAGQTFWFSNGGWPSFDVGLCVDGPCKTFVPHVVK